MLSTKEQTIRKILDIAFNIADKPEPIINKIVDFIMDKVETKDFYPWYIKRIYIAYADYIIAHETALHQLDYYEHKDFIDNYAMHLLNDPDAVKYRIKKSLADYLYFSDYTNDSAFHMKIKDETINKIYDWLIDNYSEYVTTFSGYYVGSYCIDSLSFGEQCEQLTGLWNWLTDKNVDPNFMIEAFSDKGFYIDGNKSNYAYWDLSNSGVMISLSSFIHEFMDQLTNEYNLNSK